jgi:hypothetical protein
MSKKIKLTESGFRKIVKKLIESSVDEPFYFDEGSKLAAKTRKAIEHYKRLDRARHPVSTLDRLKALAAIEAATAAERAYWEHI